MECGNDEARRIAFIQSAIVDHKNSDRYKTAVDAKLYYDGENPTINNYAKILYDIQGTPHPDKYSANHKIASRFFGFVVDQAISYLLGNGIMLKESTKKKLGPKFYEKTVRAALNAMIGGASFGFWNLDHMEDFKITEFVPLYDENNGALMAGIRFWQVAADKPLRCTLYEIDGYTEYKQTDTESLHAIQEKRKYIIHTKSSELTGTEIYDGENYPTFPIVPMKNNDDCKSELCGKRNTIDALDLACSNMVNNVDEGNIIYWALINCGGMDEKDAAEFLDEIRRTKVARLPNADEGATAEPHSIEAPYSGTQTTIDMLEKKLYQDFQAFDVSEVTAGNQTATAIRASYVPLDLKMDKFERQLTEFIKGILALAGIDDEPTYTRNQIINKQEEIQSVLMVAPYVTQEYLTHKLLTILGDADQADEILKQLAAEDLDRLGGGVQETDSGDVAPPDEAIDSAEDAVGRTLNGAQTQSLIGVITQLQSGVITEGQAVNIIAAAIGVSKEEARAIIRGE